MADDMAIAVTTKENAIKDTFYKMLSTHPVYPYVLTEDLIVCLELHSSKKVILCSRDNAATYKLSDISLEYDTVFDEHYMEQRQAKCMLEKHSFYTLK